MRLTLAILFLTLSTLLSAQSYNRHKYQVIRVVDGDTFLAMGKNGEDTKFRLIGIDCPESRYPKKSKQPISQEATEYLKSMIEDPIVYLEHDINTHDRYGKYN